MANKEIRVSDPLEKLTNGEEVRRGNVYFYLSRLRQFLSDTELLEQLLKAASNESVGVMFSPKHREVLRSQNFLWAEEGGLCRLMPEAAKIIRATLTISEGKPSLQNPAEEGTQLWTEAYLALNPPGC